MDRVLHQGAERLVHHAMARDHGLAGEARRDDRHAPVRVAAFAIAGVAAVLLALVDELERHRVEGGEARTDLGGDVHFGSSCMYLASTSDCTMMNRNMSPMPPKSLNVAQTFSE